MKAESFALVVRALAALAWPMAVVVALVMFRSQLRELVGRIAKAKFPGVELDLAPLVHEAEELSAEAEERGLDPELVARLDRVEQQIKLVASTNPTSHIVPKPRFYGGGELVWPNAAEQLRVTIKDDGRMIRLDPKTGKFEWVDPPAPG